MSAMSKLYIEVQVRSALLEVLDIDISDDTVAQLITALEERDIELRPL